LCRRSPPISFSFIVLILFPSCFTRNNKRRSHLRPPPVHPRHPTCQHAPPPAPRHHRDIGPHQGFTQFGTDPVGPYSVDAPLTPPTHQSLYSISLSRLVTYTSKPSSLRTVISVGETYSLALYRLFLSRLSSHTFHLQNFLSISNIKLSKQKFKKSLFSVTIKVLNIFYELNQTKNKSKWPRRQSPEVAELCSPNCREVVGMPQRTEPCCSTSRRCRTTSEPCPSRGSASPRGGPGTSVGGVRPLLGPFAPRKGQRVVPPPVLLAVRWSTRVRRLRVPLLLTRRSNGPDLTTASPWRPRDPASRHQTTRHP